MLGNYVRSNRLVMLMLFTFSCSSSKPIVEKNYSPPIPIEKLLNRGIVPYNKDYKSQYFDLFPYLYFNRGNQFINIKGDYFSLKHPTLKEVNVSVGLWTKYGKKRNILRAQVWVEGYTKATLDTCSIMATSSKHGYLTGQGFTKNPYRKGYHKEVVFEKQFELENSSELLKLIDDDVITITVNGQEYQFLNPELILDEGINN